MSFSMLKEWDNRGRPVRINPETGKSWTRRIRWLVSDSGTVKLKLEDGTVYKEILSAWESAAQTIWERFKAGQSIDDSISILGNDVPKHQKSRKASEDNANR